MLVRRPGSVQDPTVEPRVPARIVAADLRGSVTLLTFESLAPFRFEAGQYVALHHPQGDIPMSLASAPRRLPYFELHYRPVAGTVEAARMDQLLAGTDVGRRSVAGRSGEDHGSGTPTPFSSERIDVVGPLGEVTARHAPTLFLAGGTGAAQATGFLEWLRDFDEPPQTALWWSVATPTDLYQDGYFFDLARSDWFDYRPFVDRPAGENTLLPALAEATLPEDIVLSGPPGFVHAVAATLGRLGVDRARMRSDMFAFE